jgi:hypothetical protein
MRAIAIFILCVKFLFSASYDFDEIRFIKAIDNKIYKSGHIDISDSTVTVTYETPSYKKILKKEDNVTIEGSSGDIYSLKGKALLYTNIFIDIMSRLGEYKSLKTNKDFQVNKEGGKFQITFLENTGDVIKSALVYVRNQQVISFKLYMLNGDTIEIIKK